MSKINDGGPAFGSGTELHGCFIGITLRDYFAGQALAGWVTNIPPHPDMYPACYAIADAMIAARDGGEK